MRVEVAFFILSLAIVYALLLLTERRTLNDCIVVVTGESVTIRGCSFTTEFIEFAKGLKPYSHRV
ncbi:triple gene block protein 3 [Helleborus mosaic virus]|uniref:Movement protein TGBp3 n=1 Tax=Helleborus mosaic virus TaxID=592207 RepID=B9UZ44_9VIRU|nr:triple gene block protein 3 [Helleborus mosaic virus]ACM46000.1 triple gene block protein 3 [Helleborus mosaic virus]